MLDTRYKFIELDTILETQNKTMVFSLSDVETSDFYLKVKRNGIEFDLSPYKIILAVLNPNGVKKKKEDLIYDTDTNSIYCNLQKLFTNIEGVYSCQIVLEDVKTGEIKNTRNKFSYLVTRDILSEENNEESGTMTVIYDETTKALCFDCSAKYTEDTKIVEVI